MFTRTERTELTAAEYRRELVNVVWEDILENRDSDSPVPEQKEKLCLCLLRMRRTNLWLIPVLSRQTQTPGRERAQDEVVFCRFILFLDRPSCCIWDRPARSSVETRPAM